MEGRLQQVLDANEFIVSQNLKFEFATVQFDYEETPEAFVTCTENLLN